MGKDMKTKEIVRIDLDDVLEFGSIENAIAGVCANRYREILVADSSAMGGQTFATSGPGSGYTQQFDSGDYARAAIQQDVAESGCNPSESSVIDPSDGRIGHGVDNEDEEEDWSGEIQWEDESSVCVDCPSIEDAVGKPDIVAEMASAAIGIHYDHSDLEEWEELVTAIRKAADEFSDIDFD
jgi:hypothetical protein